MKTSITIFLVLILTNLYSFGQNKFAYYKNNGLYISTLEGEVSFLGSEVKIKNEKRIETSSYYTYSVMPNDVKISLQLSEGMSFYSALQSKDDENNWIFVERNLQNTSYNIYFYNHYTKSKNLLFPQDNSPDTKYTFIPFAWNNDILYLEARIIGSANENEGIWSYNNITKQFLKLPISSSYLTTPIISPDRNFFIYGGAINTNKNLDSPLNILFVYDLVTNQEKQVVKDDNSSFLIFGWIEDKIETFDLINIYEVESNLGKKNLTSGTQISFKLPWSSGSTQCVSTGAVGMPPVPVGSPIECGTWTTNHDNPSIDFARPSFSPFPVRAVADGLVTWAGTKNDGSGIYVKIKHSDETYTYYIHLASFSVSVGDYVKQGCQIGIEGSTGASNGIHLHFEWVDVGEAKFTNTYPIFSECGCTPLRNGQYTSNNLAGSCVVTPPPNDNCVNATPITSNGACKPGTVAGATGSYGANQCNGCSCTSPDDKDVYYYFTAQAASHTVTVSNYASNFDAVIELRTACASNSAISCYDPSGSPSSVSNTWSNLTIGQTYYIRIFEYNYSGTPPSSPTFDICVTHSTNALPDLKITAGTQSVSSNSVVAGSNITAYCSEDNSGNASAGSNHVTLWLSSNSTLVEAEDTKLGQIAFSSILALSNSLVLNSTVQIPSGTSPGNYYLFLWADGNKVVTESDEDNNFASVQISVTCTTPGAVTVSGGGTYCNSATLTISGGSGGTIYWQGTTNNGISMATPSASQTVTSSGTYYFRAYNSCGWGIQGSATVTINASPSSVAVSGGGSSCNSATLTASGGSGGTIYWQGTTSNGISMATPSASRTVTSSGTYYFRAYNSCGWGTQGSATVTINTSPSSVTVSGGGTSCNTATLTASGGSGGTIYWQGTTSNGQNTATPSTSQTVNSSGTYYFKAYNSCGWGTQGSVTVTINTTPPAPTVGSVTQPTCGISTGTITITAPTGTGMTYSINGSTYTNTTGVFTSVASGTYTVTARNSAGCTSTGTIVTINAQPVTPTAPATTLTHPTCGVSTGTINVTSPIGSGMTYSINGSTYTNTTGVFTLVTPGTYTVTARSSEGCISTGTIVTINAQPNPPTVTSLSIYDAYLSTAYGGGNVTSDGGSAITARGVCWSTTSNPTILNSKTSDGLSIGTFTSTITGLANGLTYHIRAYATNCKGTAYGSDIQYIHNSTGIEDIQGDEVSVFPNPVSGKLNIVYKDENFETIMILNSQGRLMSKEKVIKPSQQLDFSIYDSGLYILEFIKKTNEVKRIKVIKH